MYVFYRIVIILFTFQTGQDAHKTSYGTFDSNGNHIKDGIERVNC